MRELNNDEMREVIKAAQAALPADAKDNDLIILVVASTDKGEWMNRISTFKKEIANARLLVWAKNILNKDKFGERNAN